ncbi:hypothetical protein PINS_up000989 [Pythium insidiosum]|nr:hypothetical protein PINS_up000989 [Pythium insidiosum]
MLLRCVCVCIVIVADVLLLYIRCRHSCVGRLCMRCNLGDSHVQLQKTALHLAAQKGNADIVRLLLDRAVDAEAKDNDGGTPLQLAARIGSVDVVRLLLDRGSNGEEKNSVGKTALHSAAEYAHPDILRMLIDHGCDLTSTDKVGRSPLANLLASRIARTFDWLTAVRVLLRAGCEMGSAEERTLEMRENASEIASIRVCLQHWKQEKLEGRDLTDVPEEVFRLGASSVESYFTELTASTHPVYRHKICVVGPTTWGKTSLIKSLTRCKSILEKPDTRTVGIDLFSHSFEHVLADGATEKHEVTLWDFAGQEVYHSAHSLFFSRRTLFLVVVDLEAYHKVLSESFGERATVTNPRMAEFVERNIFSWLRLIFSRVAVAKVAFAGTKCDRVPPSEVDDVYLDLQMRAESWGVEIASSLPLRGKRSKSVSDFSQQIRNSLKTALGNWFVVTCVNDVAVEEFRQHLQTVLVKQGSGFLMPDSYSIVLDEVREYRGAPDESVRARLRNVFVVKDEIRKQLIQATQSRSLYGSGINIIMRTLHDLGDIIWYDEEQYTYPALVHQAVLAPEVLLDLIREVICQELFDLPSLTTAEVREDATHEQRREAYAQIAKDDNCRSWMDKLRQSGEVDEGLLRLLPVWSDMAQLEDVKESDEKTDRVLAIKSLLQEFGLAYPKHGRMQSRSCLIIPAYWKLQEQTADISESNDSLAAMASILSTHFDHNEWQYEFGSLGLPSTLFEHVVVRAFHPDVTQVIATSACVVSVINGESALRVKLDRSQDRSVLRVTGVAVTRELARQCVLFACTAIEKELLMYPGLDPCRSSLGYDGEMDELDEDDEDNEDVKWLLKRPWLTKSALDNFPRAENGWSEYSEQCLQSEGQHDDETALSLRSAVFDQKNAMTLVESDLDDDISEELLPRCLMVMTCTGSLQYPVTCEWVVSRDNELHVETIRVLTQDDWSKTSIGLNTTGKCIVQVLITQASRWCCQRPGFLSGRIEIIFSDLQQQMTLDLLNSKKQEVARLECEVSKRGVVSTPNASGG